MSLTNDPKALLAKLMALIGAVNGLAPASSPVLGGVIADYGGWKAVFIVLAAFAFFKDYKRNRQYNLAPVMIRNRPHQQLAYTEAYHTECKTKFWKIFQKTSRQQPQTV